MTPAWRLGFFTNRILVAAVAVELLALVGFLMIEPVADVLGQAWPPLVGSVVALLGIPAVLGMDAVDKHLRRRP